MRSVSGTGRCPENECSTEAPASVLMSAIYNSHPVALVIIIHIIADVSRGMYPVFFCNGFPSPESFIVFLFRGGTKNDRQTED